MPSHLLLRVAWQQKDADPKNVFVINPCFRRQLDIGDPTSGTDAQSLCDDLATAIAGWQDQTTKNVKVSAYNLQGAKPNYPLATKELNVNQPHLLNQAGQTAICLSFYGSSNIPRHRGRLYLPLNIVTSSPSAAAAPNIASTQRTKVAALVPIFANLGGANVDWIVWSRLNNAASKVEHWWVDDSWDVIRSRKFKATTRDTGTTSG